MKRVDPASIGILLIDVQPVFLEGWMAGAFEPFMTRIEHLLGLATTDQLPTIATADQPDDKKAGSPTGWSHGPFMAPASSPNRPSIAAGSRRLCTANESPRGFARLYEIRMP